ncbi:polyadenylate-binding protein-interacting protein 2B-like isoform X3 [Salvelinus namaycush]|uniref:Polyadenylate-binding protein-interacting protein 2B-like isoform X3 n=1 Tax=Salvelinus namaycush TaxID=8040 RepID=A0A8U0UFX9_SALNM|nr:polyadenylate-binding protein-interacting protein 2B-like isoform X3 [Salvelinus namaycush]
MPEPSEMSGPEVAKTPGKEGMEAVANGHAGEGEQGGDDPFAEYMWMENEDAYNRQVEEELLEQEFLERCFQEMLDEEDQDWFIPARDLPSGVGQIQQQLNGLSVSDRGNAEEMAHSLNFVGAWTLQGVKSVPQGYWPILTPMLPTVLKLARCTLDGVPFLIHTEEKQLEP